MPDPVIVPPTPTITQPPPGVDRTAGIEQVQKIFDKVLPPIRGTPKPETPPPPATPEAQPDERPPERPQREPVQRGDQPQVEPPIIAPAAKEEPKLPSFLQEALKTEPTAKAPPATQPAEVETEWPDDLPPEQKQSRIKGLRDAYKKVKEELETVKKAPSPDRQHLAYLEAQNRQMAEMLSRAGVEHSAEFQRTVIAPLYQNWNEAVRIVQESGGNPEDLRAAMSQNGRAQFEALDALFAEMPESAKAEAHDALRNYRRYEQARQAAIANAPRTMEQLRQRESQRQYQELGQQRNQMKEMFEKALGALRDEAKVEVFLKTGDPETEWWNKQGDQIVEQARSLFLENTDLNKVAFACLLAPAADAYRNLFMKAQKQVAELKQVIKDKGWSEPNLSESSGNAGMRTPDAQLQEDLKRPFAEVFLREFHRQQQRR